MGWWYSKPYHYPKWAEGLRLGLKQRAPPLRAALFGSLRLEKLHSHPFFFRFRGDPNLQRSRLGFLQDDFLIHLANLNRLLCLPCRFTASLIFFRSGLWHSLESSNACGVLGIHGQRS